MVVKLLIDDDSGPPICDRAGCGKPWPGPPRRQVPGGYRITGRTATGQPAIQLYCSEECGQLDDGRGLDGLGLA